MLAPSFMLLLLPCALALPLRSTTVHRLAPSGRVRSHGGFLGGYPFRVTGDTRSYATPDFVLRPRGGVAGVVELRDSQEGGGYQGAPEDLGSQVPGPPEVTPPDYPDSPGPPQLDQAPEDPPSQVPDYEGLSPDFSDYLGPQFGGELLDYYSDYQERADLGDFPFQIVN